MAEILFVQLQQCPSGLSYLFAYDLTIHRFVGLGQSGLLNDPRQRLRAHYCSIVAYAERARENGTIMKIRCRGADRNRHGSPGYCTGGPSIVKTYAKDLWSLLEEADITKRKAFLRSFIKRIKVNKRQAAA